MIVEWVVRGMLSIMRQNPLIKGGTHLHVDMRKCIMLITIHQMKMFHDQKKSQENDVKSPSPNFKCEGHFLKCHD